MGVDFSENSSGHTGQLTPLKTSLLHRISVSGFSAGAARARVTVMSGNRERRDAADVTVIFFNSGSRFSFLLFIFFRT